MPTRNTLLGCTALALLACASATPRPSGEPLPARRQALETLLAEHWEYTLSRAPEFASILGQKRWNDRSSDLSAAAVAAHLARLGEFRARLRAIDPSGLEDQEALTRALLLRAFQDDLDEARFENWKMPVNQMSGIHIQAATIVSLLSFRTAKDYADYVVRLGNLARQIDDTLDNMRAGMAQGLLPPRFLLEKVAEQAEAIATLAPERTPFARPLAAMPADLAEAERLRIREALLGAVRDSALPAYRRFARFVREEYAPHGRAEPGIWALPDGAARYATAARRSTTTDLSPEAIHRIGLGEVARIEGEMREAAARLGFADLASFRASLETNPALRPRSRAQILETYRAYLDAMRPELPRLFGRLPRADFKVEAIEEFREKQAAGAQYQPPSEDGSRPGTIQVNTGDFESRKTLPMESTAYHEGVPGHHLQIAIQQELPGIPPVRRFVLQYTAFAEGWALYSERLGKDIGFYRDPYSDYGRLQDEMLRAIRLVVDTGMHQLRWSREQAVAYFRAHSSIDEVEIQAETDRYIVWPGQALAYKIGQLRILELRERARAALGSRFDIRRFHDAVLGGGALPLDVLEARLGSWIAAEQARPAHG